jgi:hypothetical protein
VSITGEGNKVAIGADAVNAINTITIGGSNVASNYNVVNLQQAGLDNPNVTLIVDGNTNAINITQN